MRISPILLAASLVVGGLTAASAGEFGSRSAIYPGYVYVPYGYAPTGYAGRVPCHYPDGWNVGDSSRSLRGIPDGINHTCRVNAAGTVIDRDGDPTN